MDDHNPREESMPKSRRSVLKPVILSLLLAAVLAAAVPLAAQDRPLWLRYPAVSPDGSDHPVLLPGRHLQGARRGRRRPSR
ncbi:MAG: hypothetical protein MZU91_11145 [Desulfosudis oleivorans]|nr:hypothetical protein [Desulfosudis oleivorans]